MTSTNHQSHPPHCFVHASAQVHASVHLSPFCSIHGDVKIGAGSWIGENVVIYDGVTIGENCRIMPGTVISADASQLEFWRKSSAESCAQEMGRVIIGSGVHLENGVNLHGSIVIGDGCWIGSSVSIHDGARLGKGVKIFPGAVVSAIPQDLKFVGEKTTLEIGDNTIVREFATLNRGTSYRGKTTIGKNVLIMAYVHVAHDCAIGDHVIMVNNVNLAGHVEIEDWAILEGLAAVQQFVRIGRHAFVAGGSMVRKHVPPYVKAAREPLAYAGVNTIGLRRRNFTNEQISAIQEVYRSIFLSGMNTSQALNYVETELPPTEERDEIVTFIRKATRGIIRGYQNGEDDGLASLEEV